MRKTATLIFCMLLMGALSKTYGQLVSEGFETSSCSNNSAAFFQGCFPNWINVSGSADIESNEAGISPSEGSRYAFMYSRWRGFNCPSSPTRGESIALNYNFQANQSYTITYDLRWSNAPSACHFSESKWVLTNGKSNQLGGSNGCASGEIIPTISSSDQVVRTHSMSGSSSWQTFTVTFTPTSNYSQLWFRPEVKLKSNCSPTAQDGVNVFLDDFDLTTCVTSGYSTLFSLATSSDFAGNVTVNTQANPNPVFVNHWWDVFYAPGGSTSGNSQVPGNSIQCCGSTTSSFSNNLFVNEWYYIKHGIWNSCISWRETRKRFRVTVGGISPGGKLQYRVQVEDVEFTPTTEYLSAMNKMVEGFSDEEIAAHNQEALDLLTQPFTPSLINQPNPFSEVTRIGFELDTERAVSLYIYDVTGRKVATLLEDELQEAGSHQIKFDGRSLPEGIYISVLQSGEFQQVNKMILER
ncbi:MAG: T9SS type A sorting domain-containing protein, partial [Bacteroidota bacterium]